MQSQTLTDEEIRDIRDQTSKQSGDWHFDTLLYARAIERAVIAKAMPIPKQEPVGIIGETDCLNDVVYKLPIGTRLYTDPQPSQAAAIPERLALGSVCNSDYVKGWNDCVEIALSAAPKQDEKSPS